MQLSNFGVFRCNETHQGDKELQNNLLNPDLIGLVVTRIFARHSTLYNLFYKIGAKSIISYALQPIQRPLQTIKHHLDRRMSDNACTTLLASFLVSDSIYIHCLILWLSCKSILSMQRFVQQKRSGKTTTSACFQSLLIPGRYTAIRFWQYALSHLADVGKFFCYLRASIFGR